MGLLGSSKKKKKKTSKTITYGNGDVYVGEFKEGKDKDGKTVDVKVSSSVYMICTLLQYCYSPRIIS